MLPSISIYGIQLDQELRYKATKKLWRNRMARLVGLVFSRPELKLSKDEIIPSLSYFNFRTQGNICFYFAGYLEDDGVSWDNSWQHIDGPGNVEWVFQPDAFNEFRKEVEGMTTWRYSGESDLILTNIIFDRSGKASLSFADVVLLRLNKLNEISTMPNVSACFEKIFQYAEKQDPINPAWGFSDWAGIGVAKGGFKDLLLSWLPSPTRRTAQAMLQLVVSDISNK